MSKVYHMSTWYFFESRVMFYVSLCTLVLSFSVLHTTQINLNQQQKFVQIYFLNVDQGDSIYIVAPNGNSLLIDGGQMNNKARDNLGKIKTKFDHHIDVLLGTHSDADHIGGLAQILDTYTSSLFVESGYRNETGVYQNLKQKVKQKNIKNIFLFKNSKIILDDINTVSVEILHPSFEYTQNKFDTCKIGKKKNKNCNLVYNIDTNDMSIVALIKFGNKKILLTGDASKDVEEFLITQNKLDADILKLGHHGSKTSSGKIFLNKVNPKYSIVSAGEKNKYGHPHKSVIDAVVHNTKSKIFYTKDVETFVGFKVFEDSIIVQEK